MKPNHVPQPPNKNVPHARDLKARLFCLLVFFYKRSVPNTIRSLLSHSIDTFQRVIWQGCLAALVGMPVEIIQCISTAMTCKNDTFLKQIFMRRVFSSQCIPQQVT